MTLKSFTLLLGCLFTAPTWADLTPPCVAKPSPTSKYAYVFKRWTQSRKPITGACQIHLPVNDVDRRLWATSVANDPKEVGVIEVIGQDGSVLFTSEDMIGIRGHVPTEVIEPKLRLMFEWIRARGEAESIAAIRFTHTHDADGLSFTFIDGRAVAVQVEPRHLSSLDLRAAAYLRQVLDDSLRDRSMSMSHVALEMIAFAMVQTSLTEILYAPTWRARMELIALGTEKHPVKPAVVFLGREAN